MSIIIEKHILYGASFNPPHVGHFSAISQMLEEYDKVIIFPYPNNYANNPPDLLSITQRMKMLKIFVAEFFPQQSDRLILTDLATEMIKSKVVEGIPHTYDYLQYAKERVPLGTILNVCLGFGSENELRKESFHNEDSIEKEFGVFRLEEENKIESKALRTFFSSHKNLKSAKDEKYIKYAVGNALAEHIFKNNLYGVKKKKEKILKEQTNLSIQPEAKRPSKKM